MSTPIAVLDVALRITDEVYVAALRRDPPNKPAHEHEHELAYSEAVLVFIKSGGTLEEVIELIRSRKQETP